MKTIAILGGALALALASTGADAATAKTPPPKRDCFFVENVTNFAAADENIVNVRVGVRDVYQFEMFGPCHDVDWNTSIAIVPRGGASNICSGMDAEIISPSAIGPQRCQIRNIRKLTPEQIKALPKRARP